MCHDRIIILAGGPTVKSYDLSTLKSRGYVVGVNESFVLYDCHAGISMDRLWMENRYQLVQESDKPFWTRASAVKNIAEDIRNTFLLFECKESNILSEEPNQINGTNSGMCAMNLALHKKPKVIYLLGFDMKMTNGKNYWYEPYSWVPLAKLMKRRKYELWVAQFNDIAVLMKRLGIEVKNVTHNSALSCFPKITYEQFLKETTCKN